MARLAILVVALSAILLDTTAAKTTHVVGDSLGWVVPPGGPIAYATWAATQTFIIGDILVFNFTTGQADVARVTEQAFLTCNSTDPISIEKTGPVNITLNSTGEYYFIGTLNLNNVSSCILGQRLAINVTDNPGPTPSPAPRTEPKNYTVGDGLGWVIPPLGQIAYLTWSYNKTFIVGDTLVFNFANGSDDVAVVSKEEYRSCNTSTTIGLYNNSPAIISLNKSGEHYYTSTYKFHCDLGQKLFINVTAASSTAGTPPTSPTGTPPTSQAHSPTAGGPTASPGSAQSRISVGYFITFLSIAMAVFY